jgi:hypothetical protein
MVKIAPNRRFLDRPGMPKLYILNQWTALNFGKHSGGSLPEIIVFDADWFFWAASNSIFQGRLSREAKQLVQNALPSKSLNSIPSAGRSNILTSPPGDSVGSSWLGPMRHGIAGTVPSDGYAISICRAFGDAGDMTSGVVETCCGTFGTIISGEKNA